MAPLFRKRNGISIPTGTIAERIARYATQLGWQVEMDSSNLSSSRYLKLQKSAANSVENEESLEEVEIRVSSHGQRPSYYREVDFEVGRHQEADGDWLDCIVWLAQRDNLPMPRGCKRALTIQSKKVADNERRLVAEAEQMQQAELRAAAIRDWLKANEPHIWDRFFGPDRISGKRRKRKMQQLNAAWRRAEIALG